MLLTKEHYDLIAAFERNYNGRLDKEAKELWPKGYVYQYGHVNEAFLQFRQGYSYGKSVERDQATATRCAQKEHPHG